MTATDLELCARLREERAKLTNPIDRIVFDNQWIKGLPAGLLVLAAELEEQEKKS